MNTSAAKQLFAEAQKSFDFEQYEDALEYLDSLDAAFPESKNVMLARARCFVAMDRTEEARPLLRECIDRWDAPRAYALMKQLDGGSRAVPDGLQDAFGSPPVPPTPPSRSRAIVWTLVVILALFVVVGGSAGVLIWKYAVPLMEYEDPPPPLVTIDHEGLKQEREAKRQQRIDALHAPSTQPGLEIPREIWEQTAVNGIPKWKAGIYRKVACPGAYFLGLDGQAIARTLDIYIPMAYQDNPDERFLVVYISMPSMHPGFIALTNWAERNDAILVTINSISNGTYEGNWQAQDAALEFVMTHLRVDPQLGLAVGMSGGAATSWEMICRYSDYFSGVVMMGISRGHNGCWFPPHVMVAYIHGQHDSNNPAIEEAIGYLHDGGYQVRERVVPGEHVMGPVHVREEMLSWLAEAARRRQVH
jgi:predicted esterase